MFKAEIWVGFRGIQKEHPHFEGSPISTAHFGSPDLSASNELQVHRGAPGREVPQGRPAEAHGRPRRRLSMVPLVRRSADCQVL